MMEAVKKQAMATFRNGLNLEENISKLATLMNKITKRDVNLDLNLLQRPVDPEREGTPAPVTYIGIQENEHFSISIFILRAGSRLPLHDHPMMHGLCRVLHGCIRIKNYSFIDNPMDLLNEEQISVRKEDDKVVSEKDDTVVLTPCNGNIHEITTEGGPAAFLDVLAPPYYTEIPGHGPRPCHYYSPLEAEGNSDKLVKLNEPPDYWTDVALYQGK